VEGGLRADVERAERILKAHELRAKQESRRRQQQQQHAEAAAELAR
jgi:hypothetical protein